MTTNQGVPTRYSRHIVPIILVRTRFGPATGQFTVIAQLDHDAEAHLRRHAGRLTVHVVISSPRSPTGKMTAILM